MSAKDIHHVKKNYELVPPDGGWGYMIGIAVILNISVCTMFVSSYGVLFKEFLRELGICSTDTSLILSIRVICSAITGYLTCPLLSIMSMRKLSLLATLIYNTGVICLMFVKSVFAFHLCYGMLQGLGFGFLYNLSCTILNDYFVKRRLMAISVVQSIVAIISMGSAVFLKWFLQNYGFHDTILLVSGITVHSFIAVALMQPVNGHMKKIEASDERIEKLLHNKQPNEEGTMPVLRQTNMHINLANTNTIRISEDQENGVFKKIIMFLLIDQALSKTFLMSCVCAGPAFAIFLDTIYAEILPIALFTAGWEHDDIAMAILLYGIGDLAMRTLFILISNWLQKLGTQEIYVLGVTLGLVSRLGMLWSKSPMAIMLYIPLIGASHCAITILIPLVVADAVTPAKFTAALGMVMMMSGIAYLVLGSAIGAVRELTESYGPVFYLIASCFAIIVLFWSIELCYKKNQHKRLMRREYLQQKKINK